MKRKKNKLADKDSLLRDDVGDPSLGRWAVYYGTILSGMLSVTGVLLAAYEVIFQPMFASDYHSNAGVTILLAGVGIYTSGAISKAWSAHAEAKKMATTSFLTEESPDSTIGEVIDDTTSTENSTNG